MIAYFVGIDFFKKIFLRFSNGCLPLGRSGWGSDREEVIPTLKTEGPKVWESSLETRK